MKTKIFNIVSGNAKEITDVKEVFMNEWLDKHPGIIIHNVVFNANENRFILIMFYTENML